MDGELFCVYDACGVLGFIREAAPLFFSPSGGGDSTELRAESHTRFQTMEPGGIELRLRIVQFLHLIP